MSAFYLTLIAVLLAGIGARDQATIAALSSRQGQRIGVLVVGMACAIAASLFAAWAATFMLAQLPPPARAIFVAIALGIAGLESMVLVPRRAPDEPTHSLGALMVVLLAQQVTDAARFIVFGMGVGMASPWIAAAAGALGGLALIGFAWAAPDFLVRREARLIRRLTGGILFVVAVVILLLELGIL